MITLLENKNYVVKIKSFLQKENLKVHTVGCSVSFPKMTLINPDMPQISFRYLPIYGKKDAVIQTTKNGELTKSYETLLPNYAVRNYISLDVALSLQQLGLSSQILVYYNHLDEKVNGFYEILLAKEEEKEGFLTQLYLAGKSEGFAKYMKVAKQHKVLDGYKILAQSFN